MRFITLSLTILILVGLAGCERAKTKLDREVDRLCAIDGGVHVYETVRLGKENFGADGEVFPQYRGLPLDKGRLGPDYFYSFEVVELVSGSPNLKKSASSIKRRTDDVADDAATRSAFHASLQALASGATFQSLTCKVTLSPTLTNLAAQAQSRVAFEDTVALQTLSPFVISPVGTGILKQAASAGMNDFITKPVDAHVLYARLGRCLADGDARQAVAPQEALSRRSVDARSLAQPWPTSGDIDFQRLEVCRSIGMLDELVTVHLPELMRWTDKLERSARAGDFHACLDTLHAISGMSGEAGGRGLHQLASGIHEQMRKRGAWPDQADWVAHLRHCATHMQREMTAYAAAQRSSA